MNFIRNNERWFKLKEQLKFDRRNDYLMISVVTLGELKSLAKRRKWGKTKLLSIEIASNYFLVLDINTEDILERYAEIDAFSQGKLEGRPLGISSRNMGKTICGLLQLHP
jgi:predicted nucleic acid-binding protein